MQVFPVVKFSPHGYFLRVVITNGSFVRRLVVHLSILFISYLKVAFKHFAPYNGGLISCPQKPTLVFNLLVSTL